MDDRSQQRRRFAAFLRSRRERLSPLDVGLTPGPRRRTPGLRREEVAQLADISVTLYTWFEQARDITTTRPVLDSLARALLLNSAERRHLFGLAGEPLPAGGPTDPPSRALRQLVDALDPYPAYLLSPSWDMIAWNRAEAALIGDPATLPEPERNTLWLAFTDPSFRRLMVDWRSQALGMLTQYRADAAQPRGDLRLESLTAALRSASADFRDWWDHDVTADLQPARRQFDHPDVGLLTLDYQKLAVIEAPGVKLTTLLPADMATEEKLINLVGTVELAPPIGPLTVSA